MARGAARHDERQLCPLHSVGQVTGGHDSVQINGRPAVAVGDAVSCLGYEGALNVVTTGQVDVLVCGRPIARQWDATAHGGRIRRGSRNVLVGKGLHEQETLAAALVMIEASNFGKTARGKAILERLRGLRRDQIRFENPDEEKTGLSKKIDGYYDGHEDRIRLNSKQVGCVGDVAETLVHEGSHASRDPVGPEGLEDTFSAQSDHTDEEFRAWEDQLHFHESASPEPEDSTSIDKYGKQKTLLDKRKYIESLVTEE